MISSPSFTNIHSSVSDKFNQIRMQSLRASLLAKLYGKSHQLKTLSDVMQANFQNKKYMGVQNIFVTRIVGTISRNDDFDEFFRPRKKHLKNRWINIFLLDSDGWPPIVVHQIGDDYFVEDGHHRVSVARSKGIMFIEAEVWDHSGQDVQRSLGVPPCLLAKILIKSCAAD